MRNFENFVEILQRLYIILFSGIKESLDFWWGGLVFSLVSGENTDISKYFKMYSAILSTFITFSFLGIFIFW